MFRVNKLTHTVTYNGNRIAPIAERAEPRSLQGWWFLRNGQSRVPYEVGGFCGTGRATFLTVVLFGYLITVSLLQLNLTIQRRSGAHVGNFPPSEKIKKDSIIKQKYYPLTLIFTRTVPALLRYPKLFARIHSHNFDRYANSHFLHPPPAAVVFLAPFEGRYTAFVNLFY